MKVLITIGCKTDHGGAVVEVEPTFQIEGKPVHLEWAFLKFLNAL